MPGQRLNIVLDEERALKLRRLAERMHANPGTVACSLLLTALDRSAEIRAGNGIPLDEL